jgi:hypothetical protein
MARSCYIIAEGSFSMLAAFASNQWCINDEYKTSSNQSCHNIFLLVIVYDLSSDGFFFSNLGSTCVDEFYWFYVFYNINIISNIISSNLAALAFDQRCICDDFETSTNQFCCDQCFVGFFKKVHQRFFSFQLMASHIKSTYSYWYYIPL